MQSQNLESPDEPLLRPATFPRHRPDDAAPTTAPTLPPPLSLLPSPVAPGTQPVDPDRFGDPLDRLAKLGELRRNQIISDREFELLKTRIIYGADVRL